MPKFGIDFQSLFSGGSREAVLCTTEGKISSLGFKQRIDEAALKISTHGVRPGETIAVASERYEDLFPFMFAAWQMGAIPAVLPMGITQGRFLECLRSNHAVRIDKDWQWSTEKSIPPLEVIPGTDLILCTSGSRGVPKAVCLRAQNILENSRLTAARLEMDRINRFLLVTEPHFTSSILHSFAAWLSGCELVCEPRTIFGESLCHVLEKHACQGFGGAPVHLIRALDSSSLPIPSVVKLWISSGDRLGIHHLRLAQERYPNLQVASLYGLTEVSGRLCINETNALTPKLGSVGKPLEPMSVRVSSETTESVSGDQVGEIQVSGEFLLLGYLGGSARKSSFFSTGDLGHIDSDGYVWLKGRMDDVFKSGAEKVSSSQIAEAILSSPEVLDAAVLGIEDDLLGKVPCAFVVARSSGFEPRMVAREIRGRLPPTHMPKRWIVVERIARTGSGKIIVADLIDLLK